ncbi:lymphotoxin-beta isoform X2 [Arvicanthis niloticus]|uniref:lymphotoxin-beta isoform X2 n=1 Tax=Arvicanthis niloticus TaxID=61156 RepID=UPI00402B4F55
MGTQGLHRLGGRPQGRGCLLLAVAGATSLVTLLLAVPITVLAVLALVPQDQGRWGFNSCQSRNQKLTSAPSFLLPTS